MPFLLLFRHAQQQACALTKEWRSATALALCLSLSSLLSCAFVLALSLRRSPRAHARQQQKHTCWKRKRKRRERERATELVSVAATSANTQTQRSAASRGAERSETWMSMNVVYRFLVEFCYFHVKVRTCAANGTDCENVACVCVCVKLLLISCRAEKYVKKYTRDVCAVLN